MFNFHEHAVQIHFHQPALDRLVERSRASVSASETRLTGLSGREIINGSTWARAIGKARFDRYNEP